MVNILDRIAISYTTFRPKTMRELFALRLAQKMDDSAAAAHYFSLASDYSPETLLWAYRQARSGPAHDISKRFHQALASSNTGRSYMDHQVKLVAVKLERRSVAVAIFTGEHLEHTQVRQLSSAAERAQSSASAFIRWVMANFDIESAALEQIISGQGMRRSVLSDSVMACFRDSGIPIWQIPKQELFQAFGHPALKSRKELRAGIVSMWPILSDNRVGSQILDASALGALVQTERLFLN